LFKNCTIKFQQANGTKPIQVVADTLLTKPKENLGLYIYMVKFIYTINMENLQPDIAMALDLILILLKLNILL